MYTMWFMYSYSNGWTKVSTTGMSWVGDDVPYTGDKTSPSIEAAQLNCIACNNQTGIGWQIRDEHDQPVLQKDCNTTSWYSLTPSYKPEDELSGEKREMIKARITRPGGKLTLEVDAKEFHETLDSIGVRHDGSSYLDGPATEVSIADARTFTMSTKCLLKREYPAKFDLNGLWANPPRFDNLKTLCESAYTQARKILDHYQPIDISIEIQKKIIK